MFSPRAQHYSSTLGVCAGVRLFTILPGSQDPLGRGVISCPFPTNVDFIARPAGSRTRNLHAIAYASYQHNDDASPGVDSGPSDSRLVRILWHYLLLYIRMSSLFSVYASPSLPPLPSPSPPSPWLVKITIPMSQHSDCTHINLEKITTLRNWHVPRPLSRVVVVTVIYFNFRFIDLAIRFIILLIFFE